MCALKVDAAIAAVGEATKAGKTNQVTVCYLLAERFGKLSTLRRTPLRKCPPPPHQGSSPAQRCWRQARETL